jgi:ArsR family metal-binding transcriptional regulator
MVVLLKTPFRKATKKKKMVILNLSTKLPKIGKLNQNLQPATAFKSRIIRQTKRWRILVIFPTRSLSKMDINKKNNN